MYVHFDRNTLHLVDLARAHTGQSRHDFILAAAVRQAQVVRDRAHADRVEREAIADAERHMAAASTAARKHAARAAERA